MDEYGVLLNGYQMFIILTAILYPVQTLTSHKNTLL